MTPPPTSQDNPALIVSGIAHDLSNLFTIIIGDAEAAQARTSRDRELSVLLQRIQRSAQHAAGLTRQLFAFGCQDANPPAVADLNRMIRDVEPVLRGLIRGAIEFDVAYADDVGPVRIEPIHVERVLLNLVLNARDAMPHGGRLSMRTDDIEVIGDDVVPQGSYSRIRIEDTGIGMSAELEAHAFDPFVTTKSVGAGRGLGLAAVRSVIAESQGFISLESTVGAGTRFDVYLPRIDVGTVALSGHR